MIKTVSVAPMMDCTDKHEIYFLSLISKNIHLYSEMIVANAIIRGNRDKLLSFKKISNPVTLQIGGSNPNELAEACKISEDYGYKEINLNLGCPSKKVQKNKFGACLMQEPNLVARCIEAMSKSTKLPITIKTRIGYNDVENFEFLKSTFSEITSFSEPKTTEEYSNLLLTLSIISCSKDFSFTSASCFGKPILLESPAASITAAFIIKMILVLNRQK